MNKNFQNNIKNNIKKEDEKLISNTNTDINIVPEDQGTEEIKKTFKIGKKQEDKTDKVSFPVYMKKTKAKELDKVVKKTGYSRNELINMMLDFCLENIEFTE